MAAIGALCSVSLLTGLLAMAAGGEPGAGLPLGVALTVPVLLLGLPAAYAAAALVAVLWRLTRAEVRRLSLTKVAASSVGASLVVAALLWLLLGREVPLASISAVAPFAAFGGWVFRRVLRAQEQLVQHRER